MSCKPKTKSLRAANGLQLPIGMWQGGEMFSARGNRAADTSAFFAAATPQIAPLADPAAEQQKMLASLQDNGGPDQGQQMMQGVMQNGSSGAPGTGAGLFETGQAMRQTMNQGMSNAGALQRGLGTGVNVPTGGALGPAPQDPRMRGLPSGLMGMRDGGTLRTGHGGDVPGTGTGDKIPAKYEPGEFVVSNDMLDAEPGLLGHLRGLRKAVLAAKGTTPEQADAQALSGRGLRAHA